ncbi:hypothetical protein ALP39_200053 [Pseudomonas marginalis pv. marginalis]|nr:hypothetical protein ALP39_200053 [Pseudomonas marginalis pv. marginalis]
MLRERLSPEQIAGKLRSMNMPNLGDAYVCRETIYNAIYALPVGSVCAKARRHAGRDLEGWIGAARSPQHPCAPAGDRRQTNAWALGRRSDQGQGQRARHAEITQQTGVAIYFCDPHSSGSATATKTSTV